MKPNDRCACNSGKKFKKCCWRTQEAKRQDLIRQYEEQVKRRREEQAKYLRENPQPEPYGGANTMDAEAMMAIVSHAKGLRA